MSSLIVESDGSSRRHRSALQELLKQASGTVRIASAYVTDTQLLSSLKGRDVRLLTYLSRMDIVSGATTLDSLTALIKAGVNCRYLSEGPRLHAKVYLFGKQSAVITSANLTRNALDNNLEVGVHVSNESAAELIGWFDLLWDKANLLDLGTVSRWSQEIKLERSEYSSRWKSIATQPLPPASPTTTLAELFETAHGFFVCNTNRKYSPVDENRMHGRQFAAAWERFNFPSHMTRVRPGDAVFMYAKEVGIIGVGRAKDYAKILEPSDPDRITLGDTREWRVSTEWLAWTDATHAYRWKSPNRTFFEVSEDVQLRDDVKEHFGGIKRKADH